MPFTLSLSCHTALDKISDFYSKVSHCRYTVHQEDNPFFITTSTKPDLYSI